jgi:peptidoglycan hydrolase CwlO-like protein
LSSTRLSQVNVTRFIAVAFFCALVWVPATASAQTTGDRVASTRRAIDAAAQRWFEAQNSLATIDARIQQVEIDIHAAQARVASIRTIATARAVDAYENASVAYTGVIGDTAIDSGRRVELIDTANARGDEAIAQLTAAVENLNAQDTSLRAERDAQQHALDMVASERQALDAQLASLRAQAVREAASQRARAASVQAPASGNVYAAPTRPVATSSAVVVAAPTPAPSDSGQVSPHHNDPFLVCTRARESSGDYTAVSPSGYYGAYQFLPSTWDLTAVHAGRSDLVGVLPSRASEYDQDEMAWALYQWQGKGPWGGRC